jgi:hypothetical protein
MQQEEVMTLERILLQTIKFDLMVEHPYAYLLKFAKLVKGNVTIPVCYVYCWEEVVFHVAFGTVCFACCGPLIVYLIVYQLP